MVARAPRASLLVSVAVLAWTLAGATAASAQANDPAAAQPNDPAAAQVNDQAAYQVLGQAVPSDPRCPLDLRLPGVMADLVSNVLLRRELWPEADIRAFLTTAKHTHATGDDLVRSAARHFGLDEAALAADVVRFRHADCSHEAIPGDPSLPPGAREFGDQPDAHVGPQTRLELSPFAIDVALHVVLHELGHALVREFDLPVLANEETMADAFATHYLTTHLPDRALDVLTARTTSLMIEARQVPRDQWPVSGEHDSDARRAFTIAALAVAADPVKFAPVAACAGMSPDDIRRATDYGSEIHRSWRRMLAPLWMPGAARSTEARVVWDPGLQAPSEGPAAALMAELEGIITRFDWHSRVTVAFVPGSGGAGWNRSRRTITVHAGYLQRFVEQGRLAPTSGPAAP